MYTYTDVDGKGGRSPYHLQAKGHPKVAMNGGKENFEPSDIIPSSNNWFWWVLAVLVLIAVVLLIRKMRNRRPSTAFGYKFY